MIHRLLHGHWPIWEACDYDFLTWRYRCVMCEPSSLSAVPGTETEPENEKSAASTAVGRDVR